MSTFLGVLACIGIVALGILAQYYRYQMMVAHEYIALQKEWIDEVIEELGNKSEADGDESLDRLTDLRGGRWRALLASPNRRS